MKQLLLAICILAPLLSQAQDLTQLRGIGPFKIGQTSPSDVISLIGSEPIVFDNSKGSEFRIHEKWSKYSASAKSPRVYVFVDKGGGGEFSSPVVDTSKLVAGYKRMFVTHFSVGPVELGNIELDFMNDTLIQFQCDYDRAIDEAMLLKYGPGKKDIDEKTVECRYTHTGAEVENKERKFTTIWENGTIEAASFLWHYYDDKCKSQFISFFIVSDSVRVEAWNNAVSTKRTFDKLRQLEVKKEQLKDF